MEWVGYKNVQVIPISAYQNVNLFASAKEEMPWYNGPSLTDYLKKLGQPRRMVKKDFRMPVFSKYRIGGVGGVVVGTIKSGRIRVGEYVTNSEGYTSVVKSI